MSVQRAWGQLLVARQGETRGDPCPVPLLLGIWAYLAHQCHQSAANRTVLGTNRGEGNHLGAPMAPACTARKGGLMVGASQNSVSAGVGLGSNRGSVPVLRMIII